MIPQLGAPLGLFVASAAVRLPVVEPDRRRISSTGAGAIRSSSPSRSTSSRCSPGCASSSTPEYRAACSRAASCSRRRRARDAAHEGRATSSSAPSRRSRASRCSTWSRCSRCPGSCLFTHEPTDAGFLVIEMVGAGRPRRRSSPRACSPTGSGAATLLGVSRGADRRLQRLRAAAARRRAGSARSSHGARLRPARAVLRPVVGRGRRRSFPRRYRYTGARR